MHALQSEGRADEQRSEEGRVAEVWQTIHDTPGLQDIWQLHFAVAGGKEHNTADPFIANVDEICEGKGIHVEAMKDGSFRLTNARNKYEKGTSIRS